MKLNYLFNNYLNILTVNTGEKISGCEQLNSISKRYDKNKITNTVNYCYKLNLQSNSRL